MCTFSKGKKERLRVILHNVQYVTPQINRQSFTNKTLISHSNHQNDTSCKSNLYPRPIILPQFIICDCTHIHQRLFPPKIAHIHLPLHKIYPLPVVNKESHVGKSLRCNWRMFYHLCIKMNYRWE